MGRVEQNTAGLPTAASGMQRHHKQLTNSAKPGYKVILEEVTQARKALKLEDYHNIRPPAGYRFVPAGIPTLTTKCKEFARLDGKTVYAVITTNETRNELSKQVHRVGFHFPAEIVQRALTSLGIDLDQEDDVLRQHEIWPEETSKRRGRRHIKSAKTAKRNGHTELMKDLNLSNMKQDEVDAQAKAAILDMFPAIPMDNLYQVILHAFELGTDRVGVQLNDLSLPRRVQLAVVAHIRHVYTDYDILLHSHGWAEARARVGGKTLEVLAKWRGDKDDDIEVVEDILREVIVISDDENEMENVAVQGGISMRPKPHATQDRLRQTDRPQAYPPGAGRFDRMDARKQIWLDARERRKEPAPSLQARTDHPYYMPRSGREPPTNINPDLYERRLQGLERYPRQLIIDKQPTATGREASFVSYPQADLRPVQGTERQSFRHGHNSRASNVGQPLQPFSPSSPRPMIRLGNAISTPPGKNTAGHQGKLHISPISNDEILPSVETPMADRAPFSTFDHGAIHIDSPPSGRRPELHLLRQRSIEASPAKRKRDLTPPRQNGSSYLKQLVYRPVGETQHRHGPIRDDHRRGDGNSGKLVYMPLDAQRNGQSSYRGGQGIHSSNPPPSIQQIYLDPPIREPQLATLADRNRTYQYVPLDPIQLHRGVGNPTQPPSGSRTTLIPLDGYRDGASRGLVLRENEPPSRMLIPLDTPTYRQEREPFDVSRPLWDDPGPHYHRDELPQHHTLHQLPPAQELSYGQAHQSPNNSTPYNPFEPQAGLPQDRVALRRYDENRRHDINSR